jgi:predicted acyltransferase
MATSRLASLDQFRGYTVTGMLVVNFLGGFAITPLILRHHNTYCSYADTIMPQFLFAVGFAFRLSFLRHATEEGLAVAYRRVARRLLGLAGLAILLYSFDALPDIRQRLSEGGIGPLLAELVKRHWFQTLLHIAVTSLWILPVIRAGVAVRVAYLIFSVGLHVVLSSWFYFAWVHRPPQAIDGGPLGFLTWSIPALAGTLACDALAGNPTSRAAGKLLAWGGALMLVGYLLSCGTRLYDVPASEQDAPHPAVAGNPVLVPRERLQGRTLSTLLAEPPFVAPPPAWERQWNYWMMSQRGGTASYLIFATGLSLVLFVVFHWVCDRCGWQLGFFRTLGSNALTAYILGGLMEMLLKERMPRNASEAAVAAGLGISLGCVYLLVRLLERRGILIRL